MLSVCPCSVFTGEAQHSSARASGRFCKKFYDRISSVNTLSEEKASLVWKAHLSLLLQSQPSPQDRELLGFTKDSDFSPNAVLAKSSNNDQLAVFFSNTPEGISLRQRIIEGGTTKTTPFESEPAIFLRKKGKDRNMLRFIVSRKEAPTKETKTCKAAEEFSHGTWKNFIKNNQIQEARDYLNSCGPSLDKFESLVYRTDRTYHLRRDKDFPSAITELDNVLDQISVLLTNSKNFVDRIPYTLWKYIALTNRAICYLNSDDLDRAERDLDSIEPLLDDLPHMIVYPQLSRYQQVRSQLLSKRADKDTDPLRQLDFLKRALFHGDNLIKGYQPRESSQEKHYLLGRAHERAGDIAMKICKNSVLPWEERKPYALRSQEEFSSALNIYRKRFGGDHRYTKRVQDKLNPPQEGVPSSKLDR